MKRIVKALVAVGALGVLAHAGPARACESQQKTTMTQAEKAQQEKAQPEKGQKQKQDAKAQKAQKDESGAQAKNVAAPARPESK